MATATSSNTNKRPELRLTGNMSENFKNFELRFNDYCIQANYRDLTKDEATEQDEYYKSKQMEISALRSSMPDEALQVIRYTIEPQIANNDKNKPWIWMQKLREHYTGTVGSSLMTDRFKYWQLLQSPSESAQDWEVKVRQAGSLCQYEAITDEMNRDKFVFGLQDSTIRTELLKTHLKADNTTKKSLNDVVTEAKALEAAQKTNQLISDAKNTEEQVHVVDHLKLKREPGTCFRCGKPGGQHAWRDCDANGQTCNKCGLRDHFARVCLEDSRSNNVRGNASSRGGRRGRGRGGRPNYGNRNNNFRSSDGGGRGQHRGRYNWDGQRRGNFDGRPNNRNRQNRDVHHTEETEIYYTDETSANHEYELAYALDV